MSDKTAREENNVQSSNTSSSNVEEKASKSQKDDNKSELQEVDVETQDLDKIVGGQNVPTASEA